jgi:tetratricopeptide (TPR) repeat protein
VAESRIDELRRRIERDPGSRLFAQLAEELRKGGDVEEAIRVARAGLERHPAYPSARLTLGRALLDSGDPAAARSELEAAVRGAPDNILANRLLGEALETLGDLGGALLQYQSTLQLAPGDGHVEARIRTIQGRLGGPGTGKPEVGAPETTEPMARAGELDSAEAEEELPPTIRIRMPGDAPAGPRAPLPPPASPPAASAQGAVFAEEAAQKETTLPPPAPVEEASSPRPEGSASSGVEALATGRRLPPTERLPPPAELEAPAEEKAEAGEQAPGEAEAGSGETEDNAAAPGSSTEPAGRIETPTERLPPGSQTPQVTGTEGREEAPPGGGEAGGEAAPAGGVAEAAPAASQDSDLAPTLPRSRAAEYAALDSGEVLSPTLPPSVITGVEGTSPEEARQEDLEAAEGEPAAGAREEPPLAATGPGEVQATEEGQEASAAPVVEAVDEGQAPGIDEGVQGRQAPLSSATLAELYFQQGLLERAVEVYRQVLEEEPGNERARSRLEEIEGLVEASAAELPGPPAGQQIDPAARRRALERTIDRLEALLAVVRRR